MSFMTPILMTPSLICACAAPVASAAATNARLLSIRMFYSLSFKGSSPDYTPR